MALLLSAHNLSKSFAHRALFDSLSFGLEQGERVGLIGPNGAGKSTLLQILAGATEPDAGSVVLQKGLRVGYLPQVPSFGVGVTVESAVREGIVDGDEGEVVARVHEVLSKLDLREPERPVSELSGGWKKRVALARELVRDPDLLLLDEPTNHLDVESIIWLEDFLLRARFATLTVTHDRLFLQKVSNRIMELDRRHPGGLLSQRGDYSDFLEAKAQSLSDLAAQEQKLKNTLRRETEWLRRGAKARQTKQQARIQAALDLRETVQELSERQRKQDVQLDFSTAEKNPKKLIEAKQISKQFGGQVVLPPIDVLVSLKSRIGLLGPNGCGKSTLLRVLLGQEEPDTGTVFRNEKLQVAYFEQNRESLDPSMSLQKSVCPNGEYVDLGGRRIHVRGYLSRFLFRPEQMDLSLSKLSGGEQSRVLLARLMLQPANLLVLDEPTNDLDVETLDVLAEMLQEFEGAVLLVTHDRYFMDHVATQILGFGVDAKNQKKIESFANLEQWEEWRESNKGVSGVKAGNSGTVNRSAEKPKGKKGNPREAEKVMALIEKTEAEIQSLEKECLQPEVASNAPRLLELHSQIEEMQKKVLELYSRWESLMPS